MAANADYAANFILKQSNPAKFAKALGAGRGTLSIHLDINNRLSQQAHDIEIGFRQATGKGGIIYQVNRAALQNLQSKAKRNLDESIEKNQRFRRTNTGRLERAISSPKYNSLSPEGFQFMINDGKLLKDVPYYLAVEHGSRASVGRLVPFNILGRSGEGLGSQPTASTPANRLRTLRAPDLRRSNQSLPTDRVSNGRQTRHKSDRFLGPSERKRQIAATGHDFKSAHLNRDNVVYLRVKRPVPAYHYLQLAVDEFLKQGVYQNLLNQKSKELAKLTGMKLNPNFRGLKSA